MVGLLNVTRPLAFKCARMALLLVPAVANKIEGFGENTLEAFNTPQYPPQPP